MFWVEFNAICGGLIRSRHTLLWILATASLSGCSSPTSRRTSLLPYQPATQHPAIVTATTNQPIRAAAKEELGEKQAQAIPAVERPAPQPVDKGAALLVQSMLNRMEKRALGNDGVTHIGLSNLRNQSRATSQEFEAFCERLAGLLTHAAKDARGGSMRFTCDETETVQYQLQGAAYLNSVEGFDVWELFLSMSPSSQAWTIWQANNPVRVLRQPRPGQPQILSW